MFSEISSLIEQFQEFTQVIKILNKNLEQALKMEGDIRQLTEVMTDLRQIAADWLGYKIK